MNITKFNGDTNNIQKLDDRPVMSAEQLKEKFDKVGEDLADYINNTLIEELKDNFDSVDDSLSNKVDKVDGKGLSKNDFTDALKNKLDGIADGAEVNVQPDWNQSDNTKDDFIKNKPDLSLKEDAANKKTSLSASSTDTDYPSAKCVYDALAGKVDKVSGKGLSKNDFTDELKNKLDGIADGAEINVQPDWDQSDNNADDFIKNKPVIDNSPSSGSDNLVKSGGIYTALSGKEDASNKMTAITVLSTDDQYPSAKCVYDELSYKEDIIYHSTIDNNTATFVFTAREGEWVHYTSSAFKTLTIKINNGGYSRAYRSYLSFKSPSVLPTMIVYSASNYLLNWTGTDCYLFEGNSIFRPKAGKHYDIKFYFNGDVFVGEVNGYYEATGQTTPTSSVSGTTTITLTDCIDENSLKTLIVYGNAQQNGTPTPTNPIAVEGLGEDFSSHAEIQFIVTGSGESQSAIITLDRPLYKVGNYADYVVIDYDTRTATRYDNTALVNLISLMDGVGTSGSVYSSGACRMSWAPASSYKWVYNKETLCSHLPTYTGTPANTKDTLVNGSLNIYVVLDCAEFDPPFTPPSSNYRTMTDGENGEKTKFKNYINDKNMQILYPISQTVTTDVTSQIDWSQIPQTFTGTTVITAVGSPLPSEMEATYYYI